MSFLLFLIFIIAVGAGGFFFAYKSDQTITNFQRDNRLLRSQLNIIKEKNELLAKHTQNYSIEFLKSDNDYALLLKNSSVYVTPDESSYLMQKTSIDMQINILQKAICNNSTWYYITLPIESNINSSGWVKENTLKEFSSIKIESSIEE